MDPRVLRTQEYLRSNLSKPVAVEHLAELVSLSPSHLSHLFKNETGDTPMNYLKSLRLEKARELLETTYLSIKEVIDKVGMSDNEHFRRDFKTAYGLPPREHRKASPRWRCMVLGQQTTE